MRVEPVSVVWVVRAVHAIQVEGAGADPRHFHVPHVAGLVHSRLQRHHEGRRGVLGSVEDQQGHRGRVPAEHRELSAARSRRRPVRERSPPA